MKFANGKDANEIRSPQISDRSFENYLGDIFIQKLMSQKIHLPFDDYVFVFSLHLLKRNTELVRFANLHLPRPAKQ